VALLLRESRGAVQGVCVVYSESCLPLARRISVTPQSPVDKQCLSFRPFCPLDPRSQMASTPRRVLSELSLSFHTVDTTPEQLLTAAALAKVTSPKE
jgi:hypothetical protein